MLALTVAVAVDCGSSGQRGIVTPHDSFNLQVLCTPPEVTQVTRTSIGKYSELSINHINPSQSSWIEWSGGIYAIGNLAKHFTNSPQIEKRKFELTIPKVLAMLGAMATMLNLGNGTNIHLALLLPWSEYSDRYLLETILKDALGDYYFCGIPKSFNLASLVCLPEGGALLFQGRPAGSNFQDLDLAVLMLGYRDVSLLFLNKGVLRGMTERLGFANLVHAVAEKTAVRDWQKLTEIICKAGSSVNPNALKALLNHVSETYRQYEQERIRNAIVEAREQYFLTLSEWLKLKITGNEDELIIAGGTSRYLKGELTNLLAPIIKGKLNWCEALEKRIRTTFPEQIKTHSLEYRLADVYCLFFYLYSRIKSVEE